MRFILLTILASIIIVIFCFRENVVSISDDLLQPDLNPQLVNYLQGDWAIAGNEKYIFRINRDSLFELHNDSIKRSAGLSYRFYEAASKYFFKDSVFSFSTGKTDLSNNEFKLQVGNKNLKDSTIYTLVYVSKTRLDMITRDGTLSFKRVK